MHKYDDVALVIAIVAAAMLCFVWRLNRGNALLHRWARREKCRLIHAEYCHVLKGPFTSSRRHGGAVYRVTVEDATGKRRKAWVCCGGMIIGLISSNVLVHWDQE